MEEGGGRTRRRTKRRRRTNNLPYNWEGEGVWGRGREEKQSEIGTQHFPHDWEGNDANNLNFPSQSQGKWSQIFTTFLTNTRETSQIFLLPT